MSFENFYHESDRFQRRWRKRAIYIFIFFYLLVIGYFTLSLKPPTVTERHKRVERFCEQLPNPETSVLDYKTGTDENARPISTNLAFRTELSAEKIEGFYRKWAEAADFSIEERDGGINAYLSFRKTSLNLLVRLIPVSETKYIVRCTEEFHELNSD